ncbi:MAG: Bifunctional purine biosynthesis protein PurH [Anaerolineae bacterium]|nr:Bifunctional purine biosynthesis protein PurH [Anaerolineae bacterium]
MPTALLSVSDKTGATEFAAALAELGWTLVASGGTARQLAEAGLPVTDVASLTGAPEMLGGRVKTLHPKIHGGILARDSAADRAELAQHGITAIDVVVCNLYPFQQTVAKPGVELDEAIEHIDIGGVTLLRAAAKNFDRVTVICDPADYPTVAGELRVNGRVSADLRAELARKAFAHTAEYDAAISNYLFDQSGDLPGRLAMSLVKVQGMRYGENPHQSAALYAARADIGPLGGTRLQGKELSYNNMLDLDAAWRAALSFTEPTVVIVKHLSPCGIASAASLVDAFGPALASDPVSAFGGVIAVNREFDDAIAGALGDLFVEAIAAPGFSAEALAVLEKRKNCRLVAIDKDVAGKMEFRSITGGLLVQERDTGDPASTDWNVVSDRQPSAEELSALKFAWIAAQHVKSNSIVFAAGAATVGIGGGLPSRVDAVKLAATKAGDKARGAVMASDAFFPFPDGIEAAAAAGVTAVVQPGGSIRDKEVIEAVNKLGLVMVFTGVRHFRH